MGPPVAKVVAPEIEVAPLPLGSPLKTPTLFSISRKEVRGWGVGAKPTIVAMRMCAALTDIPNRVQVRGLVAVAA